MAKRKKGMGAIETTTEVLKDGVALGLGGVGAVYINKFGSMSPILPAYAGSIVNIAIGVALKKLVNNSMVDNIGNGMIAVAIVNLASGFGINGEFINGTDANMAYAAYNNRMGIKGLIKDNAVQSDLDLQEIHN
jgi:hypothetical protein